MLVLEVVLGDSESLSPAIVVGGSGLVVVEDDDEMGGRSAARRPVGRRGKLGDRQAEGEKTLKWPHEVTPLGVNW